MPVCSKNKQPKALKPTHFYCTTIPISTVYRFLAPQTCLVIKQIAKQQQGSSHRQLQCPRYTVLRQRNRTISRNLRPGTQTHSLPEASRERAECSVQRSTLFDCTYMHNRVTTETISFLERTSHAYEKKKYLVDYTVVKSLNISCCPFKNRHFNGRITLP